MAKIKTGDEVVVIAGRDKGRRGNVLKVTANGKLLVEGVNMVKKHVKANPMAGVPGGIQEKESSIDASNVMLFNPEKNKGDRVGFKFDDSGKKVRYFKSTGELV